MKIAKKVQRNVKHVPRYEVSFGESRGRQITVIAGTAGIWVFHFRCGERPIAPGGCIEWFCEVPKFWLGTCKQAGNPEIEDYCWVDTDKGVEAVLEVVPQNWKTLEWAVIRLPGGLKQGQEVRFGLGTEKNPIDTIPHIYPQASISPRVDFFGDGSAYKLWPPIVIDVIFGPAKRLTVILPSRIGTGETFEIKVRTEDANSNIGAKLKRGIVLCLLGPEAERQTEVQLTKGTGIFQLWKMSSPGLYRVKAYSIEDKSICGISNPMLCDPGTLPVRIYWGDCHCHTGWSDGIGTLEYNIAFGRDKAFLDVFGFAEHLVADKDYTTAPVDKPGSDWSYLGPYLASVSNLYNEPGKYVTILGCEYTPQGEHHEPAGDCCIFSPDDDWLQMPMAKEVRDLFGLAKEAGCLVIPHVGGRTINWNNITFDADITPLVEIASMHEHSEYFAQWGLQQGYKIGFCGMSDGHFGMPGYDNWAQHGRSREIIRPSYARI